MEDEGLLRWVFSKVKIYALKTKAYCCSYGHGSKLCQTSESCSLTLRTSYCFFSPRFLGPSGSAAVAGVGRGRSWRTGSAGTAGRSGAAVTGAWERSRRTGNAGRLTDGAGLPDSGEEAEPTDGAGKAGPRQTGRSGIDRQCEGSRPSRQRRQRGGGGID